MDDIQHTAVDPDLRRKNVRLGLIIAGLFLCSSIAALIKFSFHGLPMSMKEHERLEQRRSADQALHQADQPGSTPQGIEP